MRLIDADAAKKALTGWDTDPTDEEIEYTIDHIPTIDAVPVVRCKDCEFWSRYRDVVDSPNGFCFCYNETIGGNDFCAYGVKKADER